MVYSVKEIFYSIQGEGVHTGMPMVFVRFSGCNLWSGREQDRAEAICDFCDTDIVGTDGLGGGKFKTASELAKCAADFWPKEGLYKWPKLDKWVVLTGGEPLLQVDEKLISEFHKQGFKIALETNGTIKAPKGIDWICVSPKSDAMLMQTKGDELKLVYPQAKNQPADFADLDFKYFSLQPKEEKGRDNWQAALNYCLKNPQWRLSLQTHKILKVR